MLGIEFNAFGLIVTSQTKTAEKLQNKRYSMLDIFPVRDFKVVSIHLTTKGLLEVS